MESGKERDLREQLIRELTDLRQWAGLTSTRVERKAPRLRRLAREWAQQRRRDLVRSVNEIAIDLVATGLEELEQSGYEELRKLAALRYAYGIGLPAHTSPKDRSTVDKRRRLYGAREPDRLEEWEDEVIPHLAETLIGLARRSLEEPRPAAPQQPDLRIAASRFTYIFDDSGVPRECMIEREVEALADGAQRLQVHHRYLSDPRPGVVAVEPYTDCQVVKSTWFEPMAVSVFEIELPEPLAKGSRRRFSCKLLVRTNERCASILDVAPDGSMEEYWLQAQFHPNYLPQQIWAFRDVTPFAIPEEPGAGQELPLSGFGFTEARFKDLRGGLHYGLIWKWSS